MAFDSVLGHDRIKALFARALGEGRMRSALLFTGPEGVGKKHLALLIARALVCQRGGGEPCDACPACGRAARGLHPDLLLLAPEGNSLKIDQVRDVVREIQGRPFEARSRAFVVDDAHLMTEQASNALLKSLEEPPPTSHVILVTASPQALLTTIRSRCQTVRFAALPNGTVEAFLRARDKMSDDVHLRAQLSGGSLKTALDFEAGAYRGHRDAVLELLEALPGGSAADRIAAAERLAEADEPEVALTGLRSLLRDVVALRAGARGEDLLNADVAQRLARLASGRVGPRAVELAEAAGETRAALRANGNRLLALDELLDRIALS